VVFGTKELTLPASQPGSVWTFNGEYWKAKEGRQWAGLPDLY
jgi:hypothetical protein